MTKARKKRGAGLKNLHWSIPAAGSAAALLLAYWLFAPTSTLRVAVPHPRLPIIRVAIVDTGANRYSFPLRVRWLDARGLKALRRSEWTAAEEIFSQSLTLKPSNPRALADRGTAKIMLDRLDEAREDYAAAILEESHLRTLLSKNIGRSYYKRGSEQVGKRDIKKAISYLEKAIAVDPKNGLAYLELGSLDILAGRYEDCIEHINHALELDTGLKLAYDNRGACYSAMGKYPEALEDLNKALILFPDRAETYGTRAGVHIWLKDYAAALRDAHKAVELKPELKSALEPLIQMAKKKIRK